MKPVLLRIATYTSIFLIVLFAGAFAWANWNPPMPGERAQVVNFIPYDISTIGDSLKLVKIEQSIEEIGGVRGATFNTESGIMSVAYLIEEVDRETIESTVQNGFHIRLKEKQFQQTGPRCPVGGSMTLVARFRRFLCVRN